MAEVYSTGVAMTFNAAGNKKKDKFEKNKADKKPKLNAEELDAKFRSKLEKVVAQDGGQYIEFENGTGLLVGGVKQNKRYYFLWLDRDRNIRTTDSKETFHLVRDIPISLSILDYLLRNECQCLRDIVNNFIKNEEESNADDKYTLVGKINFGYRADMDNRDARANRNNKNQKKKNNKGASNGDKKQDNNSSNSKKKNRNKKQQNQQQQ